MFARGTSILVAAAIAAACAGGDASTGTSPAAALAPARSPVPVIDQTQVRLPRKAGSLRFAVIGDSGRGSRPQYDVAARMEAWRKEFSFDFVLMAGDNVYDGGTPEDYRLKFELPYKPFLDADVKFYAALGNHDDPNQPDYKLFNTGGERYYTFAKRMGVIGAGEARFFVLDTVHLDHQQLRWLDNELGRAKADWKIALFHHPIYTSGRYRTHAAELRRRLEPIFVRHGVDVAFSGHEHFYERTTPQHGITYFVTGGAGSLRRGDIGADAGGGRRAVAFDQDYSFLLVEIEGDELFFQAVSRAGETIDAGVLRKDTKTPSLTTADTPGAR
ncbi:MAG TPA: metallophosphoesterase [Vicinamibacterales bacterium]|jgi:3',5'-cyclic AMP phosphodiesterase CpdA|nr:metallophosphoesterase [Vicinamibacterales bacterium]